MIVGFVIWSGVSLFIFGVGVWIWRSERAAGFYSGVEPPEVSDVKRYNRAVGTLWFVYAALMELLGLPLLTLEQNDAGFVWSMLGVVAITIGLMAAYHRILDKYGVRRGDRKA